VELAKVRAREMMTAYEQDGRLPDVMASWEGAEASVFSPTGSPGPNEAIPAFLDGVPSGDYIAIHAYVEPSAEMDRALATLRMRLRDRYRLATTVGYGPRFLHSTGQLHKGGPDKGQFIQITGGDRIDVPIPDEPGSDDSKATFGTLRAAQALGDRQALIDAGRRVVRLHYSTPTPDAIEDLARTL
jgi:glucose-6-phosphate isomerase/transaldolase/glucose-6-phosphate isomerase